MPDGSAQFGKVQPITVEISKPILIVTNVQAFPWNVLIVDGSLQRGTRIYAVTSSSFSSWMRPTVEGVALSPGKHVLEYRFVPDKAWQTLDFISWIFLLAWIVVAAIALFKTTWKTIQYD